VAAGLRLQIANCKLRIWIVRSHGKEFSRGGAEKRLIQEFSAPLRLCVKFISFSSNEGIGIENRSASEDQGGGGCWIVSVR
jgi:hypothetical protein